MSDPTDKIARFVVDTQFNSLPSDLVVRAKQLILDVIAVSLAGTTCAGVPEIVNMIREWGGKEESTIIVYGGKFPAPMAAFANGVIARAIDMGDNHIYGGHNSEYVIPALFATAEMQGGISGKEFITAFILGTEIGARIGFAGHAVDECNKRGMASSFIGKLGAPTAVAKLLNFDVQQMKTTLGIAYSVLGSWTLRKLEPVSTSMVYGEHGFQCERAVKSALLARTGLTAPTEIFLGKSGLFELFLPWNYDTELLTADLGEKWLAGHFRIKMFASCFYTHTPIRGIIKIMEDNHIALEDIAAIHCTISPAANAVVGGPEKWVDLKDRVEAFASLPFTVATAAAKRKVFLDDFNSEEMANTEILKLMQKITVDVDEKLEGVLRLSSVVSVKLKDGIEFTQRTLDMKGSPDDPVTWDEIVEKMQRCAEYSAKTLPEGNIQKVIKMVEALEEVDDVAAVMSLLTG